MCKSKSIDKPDMDLQTIFKEVGAKFRNEHKLPYEAHKAMNAIEVCHTGTLGYHLVKCDCGYEKTVYNSCRNRHCPACQSFKSAKWVSEREAELLPVPYFHVTFTIPHEYNSLVLWNKKSMYDILFQSAWESVKALVSDEKHLGGQAGAIAVLHTWGQNLMEHPHVHMIVPGGALNKANAEWLQKSLKRKENGKKLKDFLVPVGPLKILYKNKFLAALTKAFKMGELQFSEPIEYLKNSASFYALKDKTFKKSWNINIKEPFAGPEEVLRYLGRYTHRVAITNSRIISMENGKVSFWVKDYKDECKKKVCVLDAGEFIRRFLLHILPDEFRKIRMFGFLANRYKMRNLEFIRESLRLIPAKIIKIKKKVHEIILAFFGINILKCPECGSDSLKICYATVNNGKATRFQ